MTKPDCDICEKTWEMYEKEPMCEICIPVLMPENRLIFDIYILVRNQHIMGFGGPIDLHFPSVKIAMDMMGVRRKDQKEVFDKVYQLYGITLSKIREDAESSKEPVAMIPQLDPKLREYLK